MREPPASLARWRPRVEARLVDARIGQKDDCKRRRCRKKESCRVGWKARKEGDNDVDVDTDLCFEQIVGVCNSVRGERLRAGVAGGAGRFGAAPVARSWPGPRGRLASGLGLSPENAFSLFLPKTRSLLAVPASELGWALKARIEVWRDNCKSRLVETAMSDRARVRAIAVAIAFIYKFINLG